MHFGIGNTVEVVASGYVCIQVGWILVPTRMLQSVIGSRGAVHRGCEPGVRVSYKEGDNVVSCREFSVKYL